MRQLILFFSNLFYFYYLFIYLKIFTLSTPSWNYECVKSLYRLWFITLLRRGYKYTARLNCQFVTLLSYLFVASFYRHFLFYLFFCLLTPCLVCLIQIRFFFFGWYVQMRFRALNFKN